MSTLSNTELLQKATLTTGDFGGAGAAPLKIEAADRFIELMTVGQQLLGDVQIVTHTASKWQAATIQFASRIMRPGVQATRLADADRSKPSTGIIEMSTVLVKGEVPVADEVFEDNLEGEAFAATLENLIADRAGFDLEELAIQGDTTSADPYLALLDGWLRQAHGTGGHVTDATGVVDANGDPDYRTVFTRLLLSLPERARRNIETDGRFYIPTRLETLWRNDLANRNTPMGDLAITDAGDLRFQGIQLKGVSTLPIVAGNGSTIPDQSTIFLTNKNNLYAGFRRQINIESFRDPREGSTSFIVTCRFDAKIADVTAVAVADNVNVTVR